jgi:hypothetical protein
MLWLLGRGNVYTGEEIVVPETTGDQFEDKFK